MKHQGLPVKRRPAKNRPVRTLFANVSRKRHRAATAAAADFEGDVPNLGVARALVVILLIHVVAIAGIFVHSRWIDSGSAETAIPQVAAVEAPVSAPKPPPVAGEENLPKVRSGDSIYTVGTGDSYANIATRFGVVEEDLRRANDNIPVRPGRYLRIPPKTITAVEPVEITEIRERPVSDQVVVEAPVAPPVQAVGPAGNELPEMITTDAAKAADAVLVRPQTQTQTQTKTQTSQQVQASSAAVGGGTSYKVKSGDTFWAIARKYGTTPEVLMKANNISNARHLKIGMSLKIPD